MRVKRLDLYNENSNVYWQGQDIWCGLHLISYGKALGKRLRKLGLNVKVIDNAESHVDHDVDIDY